MIGDIQEQLEIGQIWKDSRGETWRVLKFKNSVAVLESTMKPGYSRECTAKGGFFSTIPAGLVERLG